MSFQTCINVFMLNTKEDILKNFEEMLTSRERNTMEVNGDHQLFDYQHSSKHLFFVQHKKETHTGLERRK